MPRQCPSALFFLSLTVVAITTTVPPFGPLDQPIVQDCSRPIIIQSSFPSAPAPIILEQLQGVYHADYFCGPECQNELINVYQTRINGSSLLIGIKVKGDPWVPSNELSFVVEIKKEGMVAIVIGASFGFINPVPKLERVILMNETYFIIDNPVSHLVGPIHLYKLRDFDHHDRTLVDMLLFASISNKNGAEYVKERTVVQETFKKCTEQIVKEAQISQEKLEKEAIFKEAFVTLFHFAMYFVIAYFVIWFLLALV